MMSSMILFACLFCLLVVSANAASSNSLRVHTEDNDSEVSTIGFECGVILVHFQFASVTSDLCHPLR